MDTIWAPWRLEYIQADEPDEGCFLCRAWEATGEERKHLVLARGQQAYILMNRYPYNNAHLMIAPVRHIGSMEEVDERESAEMWQLTVTAKEVLAETVGMHGCNIGINQGRVAGAGVLDHIHIHIVPRWNGDTNFMPVLADIKVMPQALESCYDQLRPGFAARGL